MYRFPVSGAHVLMFARAIGEDEAAFGEVERMLATGPDAIVAPPTFLMAADCFDPDFTRRPRADRPWIGSDGASPRPTGFHLEQEFTFRRPVRVGDVLTARRREGKRWQRVGRQVGTMSFTEDFTDFTDSTDAPVATARWVSATTEHTPPATPAAAAPSAAGPTSAPPAPRPPRSEVVAEDLTVGTTWSTTVVSDLSPTRFVMYAGASGDFHPTHIDHRYAVERGYPGVFAHGMLTMGLSGRAITDRFGHAAVRSFRGRMRSPVWPGSTLTTTVEVTGSGVRPEGSQLDLTVTTVDQRGLAVFDGHAAVVTRLGAPPAPR